MDLRQVEWKVLLQLRSRSWTTISARSSWIGDYNDAEHVSRLFISNNGNNRTGWKNAQYDELIHEANQQTDPKQREKLFQQAETMLVRDEVPIIPIYFYAGLNYFDRKNPGHLPEYSRRAPAQPHS